MSPTRTQIEWLDSPAIIWAVHDGVRIPKFLTTYSRSFLEEQLPSMVKRGLPDYMQEWCVKRIQVLKTRELLRSK